VRVLIVSDTHGCIDARIAALASECDAVAHAGDVGSAAVLAALGPNLVAVRGNNDVAVKWQSADHDRLARLPLEALIELPGGHLAVVHGDRWPAAGRHAALRRAFPAVRAVVYGHSHQLAVDDAAQPWILNPGAAGRARTNGGPSCLLLQAGARRWQVQVVRHCDGFQA
jgi:putative phosphoesterase